MPVLTIQRKLSCAWIENFISAVMESSEVPRQAQGSQVE
jgi:hypothetical protein